MADVYIRREDAITIAESYNIKREGFHLNDYEYGRDQVASSIASDLEDMSPADVVQVCRCRSCKEYEYSLRWCELLQTTVQPNDFCSYGERREENRNDI